MAEVRLASPAVVRSVRTSASRAQPETGVWHRPALLNLVSDLLMLFAALALGWALLTLGSAAPAVRMALASTAGVIAMFALSGYVYGAAAFYAAPQPHWGMAPHTTIGMLLLSAGVLAVRPESARAPAVLPACCPAGGVV